MSTLRNTFAAMACAAIPALAPGAMAREITHAMGTTEVPDSPQRIVILTNEGTEALLAVGIKPVGAVRSGWASLGTTISLRTWPTPPWSARNRR
ncbi:hypothetical protein N8D56_01040 [Devosia sp. A8/3-2]|nr:hypothetical protein N8D56_01040 [Devosia sp. A8/3-2]